MSHVSKNAEETCLNKNQPEGVGPQRRKDASPHLFSGNQNAASTSSTLVATDNDTTAQMTSDNMQAEDEDNETTAQTASDNMKVEDEKHEYPEGGLQAWLVVSGCWCASFLVFGIVNTTAVFQDYLSSHQLSNYSTGDIGWIFSVQLFLVFFLSLYVGPIFDAYGSRLLVALGSLGIVLAMELLSFCTQYWHFMLVYSILGGCGNAMLNVPSYVAVGHFFNRRQGLATGIVFTSGSIGGIVLPLMLRSLLPKIGFAWSVRILGFLLLALAVPANLFIRKRLPSNGKRPTLLPDLNSLLDMRFALCVTGMFLMEWGLFVPISYISSYVSANGGGDSLAFSVIALLNAGSFFGRFIPGYLADRFGRFNVIIVTIALCAITVLALWLPAGSSEGLIIAFAVIFGFVSGSNLGLIPVCLAQLCETENFGRASSAAYFVISFGTLTSIPIAGQILEKTGGDYWGLIVFSGVSYAGALVCYVSSRVIAVGWNPRTFF